MSDSTIRSLKNRIRTRYRTFLSQLFFKRDLRIRVKVPIISFTFDDFPRSALVEGGAILNKYEVKATFYCSLGLMGKETVVGEMFRSADLISLLEQGHELGCHTYGHLDPWNTSPDQFEKSIIANADAVEKSVPGFVFRSFSYPLFYPLPQVKYRASRHFMCCRGGGQKNNVSLADLNLLKAFFLERSRGNANEVKNLIDKNREVRGWLIFATHDISGKPSPFGCTPAFFEDIVDYSIRSGSVILHVNRAYEILSASNSQLP